MNAENWEMLGADSVRARHAAVTHPGPGAAQ